MIKEGQIYKSKESGIIAVISAIGNLDFWLIMQDGSAVRLLIEKAYNIPIQCNLIAEYPTWQEAVNSKEFNNEN